MGYLLGIDVGTAFTAAAVVHLDNPGEPEMLRLGDHCTDVPSVLYLGPDDTLLVGKPAQRRAFTEPQRVAREFTRRTGESSPHLIGGQPYPAEQLHARLVRWVVDRAAQREGAPPEAITVAHPATWSSNDQQSFARALAALDIRAGLLTEPHAAALQHAAGRNLAADTTLAVYDLGCSFDAAILTMLHGQSRFVLLGDPRSLDLGGAVFDQAVFDYVRGATPELAQAFAALDESDSEAQAAVARIRRDCSEAKETLSTEAEVAIPVLLPELRTTVRLQRREFEQAIGPLVDRTLTALDQALVGAGRCPEQLATILLVGGCARIPLIAQRLSRHANRPVTLDADPRNVIAKGAALALAPAREQPGRSAMSEAGAEAVARREARTAGASGPQAQVVVANAPTPPTQTVANAPTPPTPTAAGGSGVAGNSAGRADDRTADLPTVGSWPDRPPAWQEPVTVAEGYPEPAPALSPGVVVGAGAVLAALVVLGGMVFWPRGDLAVGPGDATPWTDTGAIVMAPPPEPPPAPHTGQPAPRPTATTPPGTPTLTTPAPSPTPTPTPTPTHTQAPTPTSTPTQTATSTSSVKPTPGPTTTQR